MHSVPVTLLTLARAQVPFSEMDPTTDCMDLSGNNIVFTSGMFKAFGDGAHAHARAYVCVCGSRSTAQCRLRAVLTHLELSNNTWFGACVRSARPRSHPPESQSCACTQAISPDPTCSPRDCSKASRIW